MRTFRYHNMILVIGFLFGIGLASHFMGQKLQKTGNDQITSWLLTFADQAKSDLASEKLRAALSDDTQNLESALLRASEVIANNPDLFNIPNNADESGNEEVLRVLISQWNQHQETGGMSKGIQAERSRAATTNSYEHTQPKYSYSAVLHTLKSGTDYIGELYPGLGKLLGFVIRPLIDGISINAP